MVEKNYFYYQTTFSSSKKMFQLARGVDFFIFYFWLCTYLWRMGQTMRDQTNVYFLL